MNFYADRVNAGETLQQRARAIGIDHRTLRKLEIDGLMPAAPAAKKVADHYGKLVTELWPLDPEPQDMAA